MTILFFISVLTALVLGFLAAADLIVAKKPEAKVMVDRLTPFAGIVGLIGLVLGLIGLLNSLRYFVPISLLFNLCLLALGLIFGLALIRQSAELPPLEKLVSKLQPFRAILGIVLLVLTAIALIRYFF